MPNFLRILILAAVALTIGACNYEQVTPQGSLPVCPYPGADGCK